MKTKKASKVTKEKKPDSFSKKEKFFSYLTLSRAGNSFMAGIAILVGFFLSNGSNTLLALLAVISGMLVCSGGQAINDYFDAEIDKKGSKERPIPSGKITKKEALYFAIGLFVLGLVSSALINPTTLTIALVMAILLIAYPLFMNKIKYIGNFVVALGTAITFMYGATATGLIPLVVQFVFASAFFSNMGREITKDIEDVRKDNGVKKTLPMLIGSHYSKLFVLAYYSLAMIIALYAYAALNLNNYFLAFILLSGTFFAYSLFLLFENNPKKSKSISKIGMLLSLIAFILIGLK